MMFGDLLKISRWMAIVAIIFCSLATCIAYFSVDILEGLTKPFLFIGIFVWVLSVIWFMWGWLRNANEDSNERKGVAATSYILAFLPLCYCFLMATDEARTKISIELTNEGAPLHSVKIFGTGTIFLNQDTLKLPGLASGEVVDYRIKASIDPQHRMEGEVLMHYSIGKEKKVKRIAGPFSNSGQWELKQEWKASVSEAKPE
jgi:hypothetical protein